MIPDELKSAIFAAKEKVWMKEKNETKMYNSMCIFIDAIINVVITSSIIWLIDKSYLQSVLSF